MQEVASSLQGMYMYIVLAIYLTAIVKGRNRNSYEYKNCTTDLYSGKITSVLFHFIGQTEYNLH